MKNLLKIKIIGIIAGLLIATFSCDADFLEAESRYPTEDQIDEMASASPAALLGVSESLISGIYNYQVSFPGQPEGNYHDQFGQKAIDLSIDMMGNDIAADPLTWFMWDYDNDNRSSNYRRPLFIWSHYYKLISDANDIINLIPEADDIDPESDAYERLIDIRSQAIAIRAYSLFNLVQNFQHTYIGNENAPGVPIYIEGNVDPQPRATVSEVYDQIIDDLETAYTYISLKPDNVEIDKDVVAGLLARVYLVMNDWGKAATYANEITSKYNPMSAEDWHSGFSDINNNEWLWGMEMDSENSTIYASFFSHISNYEPGYAGLGYSYKFIDKNLYESIPDSDERKKVFADADGIAAADTNWTAADESSRPYISYKFRGSLSAPFEGDYIYMRAGEMFLIEAEALAKGGNEEDAIDVLEFFIQTRDSLYVADHLSGDDLFEEIYHQRRIELWGEGHGMNDLRRLKKDIDRRESNHHPGILDYMEYPNPRYIYQIPISEIETNPNINAGDQNP